jgi:DNA mismatch endonuclease (patch repair protein)
MIGRANRRRDTTPEVALRSELHLRKLRFRKDYLVRTAHIKSHVDVCFTAARVAVFVDGCFWHVCPIHHVPPKRNLAYWTPKLAANVQRDRRVTEALLAEGWAVLRVWEHEAVVSAATHIEALVRARRAHGR